MAVLLLMAVLFRGWKRLPMATRSRPSTGDRDASALPALRECTLALQPSQSHSRREDVSTLLSEEPQDPGGCRDRGRSQRHR